MFISVRPVGVLVVIVVVIVVIVVKVDEVMVDGVMVDGVMVDVLIAWNLEIQNHICHTKKHNYESIYCQETPQLFMVVSHNNMYKLY